MKKNKKKNVDIVDVCVYKKNKEFRVKDLVSNFDEFSGTCEFNFDNLELVAYDASDTAYIINEYGEIVRESRDYFDPECIVGEGYDVDCALETADRTVMAEIFENN